LKFLVQWPSWGLIETEKLWPLKDRASQFRLTVRFIQLPSEIRVTALGPGADGLIRIAALGPSPAGRERRLQGNQNSLGTPHPLSHANDVLNRDWFC